MLSNPSVHISTHLSYPLYLKYCKNLGTYQKEGKKEGIPQAPTTSTPPQWSGYKGANKAPQPPDICHARGTSHFLPNIDLDPACPPLYIIPFKSVHGHQNSHLFHISLSIKNNIFYVHYNSGYTDHLSFYAWI